MDRNIFHYIFSRIETCIFLLSLAVIHGFSFQVADCMNPSLIPDAETYLGIFNFDFDQNPVRKYRVIIPLLARAVHFVFGDIFGKFQPDTFPSDFSVGMSFLVVNNIIMAAFSVIVFKYISSYTSWFLAALVGLISMLTCRWTGGFAGLPLVDSFYLLVLATTLLGLKTRNTPCLSTAPWSRKSRSKGLPTIQELVRLTILKNPVSMTRWRSMSFRTSAQANAYFFWSHHLGMEKGSTNVVETCTSDALGKSSV